MKAPFLAALVLLATPALAQPALQQRVEARLAQAGPGVRFGLVVADEAGRELVAINPEGRFIPASNTKMFTTAATFATLGGLDQPDLAAGTEVGLEGSDVVLVGHGDARLSSADTCLSDCLAKLADAVAARTRKIRNVIGDDRAFVDDRWSPGMSWNNIPTSSGTAISALTLDDNVVTVTVSPAAVGAPAQLSGSDYYRVDNRSRTVSDGETKLSFSRMPKSFDLVLTGTIRSDAKPEELTLGIDDPAHYAAWRLKALLKARGVRVSGEVLSRHRIADQSPAPPGAAASSPAILARLAPPPLIEDLVRTNKESQNLHAELLLRRIGEAGGEPSIAGGLKRVAAMLQQAGVARTGWDLSDGSGMSTYNRASPRGLVTLLRWIAAQPWGAAWKATLPVASLDGTLKNRFKDGPLQQRLFAKTGTLNATSALSGWLVARSGRILTFSFFANDVPEGLKVNPEMDAALTIVAESN